MLSCALKNVTRTRTNQYLFGPKYFLKTGKEKNARQAIAQFQSFCSINNGF